MQIENAIKCHPILVERTRSLILNCKKYVELLHIEGLAFTELDKIVREIITDIEFSPANYMKILEENKALKRQIEQLQVANHTNEVILLKCDNERLTRENAKLIKKYNTLTNRISSDGSLPADLPLIQPNQVLAAFKKHIRNKQGTYTIAGHDYQKNEGTRQEVWDGIAYQTSGLLHKADLIVNKEGKLVSKKKSISSALQSNLEP